MLIQSVLVSSESNLRSCSQSVAKTLGPVNYLTHTHTDIYDAVTSFMTLFGYYPLPKPHQKKGVWGDRPMAPYNKDHN